MAANSKGAAVAEVVDALLVADDELPHAAANSPNVAISDAPAMR